MAKNVERLQAREAKELIRREKQLGARSNKFYLIYLFMILSLIYITDEIASTISIQFQANIVTEFFVKNMGMEYGAGLSLFSAIGFISYPVTLLIIFYRPLADKFGRKPFLVINTLCMGLGLFLVYLSKDIYVYMIGGTLMGFMVSHDMQCVYILECSDKKSRARNYAIVKAVAILGTLLVPLLRATLMQNVSERWHVVYLVPAIVGFVMSLFALLFAKETNAFLIKRIEYLKTPIEEREQRSKEGREQNAQGREPEICDLADYLNSCGADISGAGEGVVVIEGVSSLCGSVHTIIPDRIVAATLMSCAAVTGSKIILNGIISSHLAALIPIFKNAGCKIRISDGNLEINAPERLKSMKTIRTMPFPGFPTDAQAPLLATACVADGTTVFVENIFENRYRHIPELVRMGAAVKTEGKVAVVEGVEILYGAPVEAPDLRGGAALVVAGLCAEGKTEIGGVEYIERGYECIESTLTSIGADIKKI